MTRRLDCFIQYFVFYFTSVKIYFSFLLAEFLLDCSFFKFDLEKLLQLLTFEIYSYQRSHLL
ncbi:hypothetical protein T02_3857 [Trichinella nativa]|uniref:Uncharacterized protein n=1 Tax=Trichinella nativa TaxID=6335 RepID=A0A0V1KSV6_9BILA|nr:hypothetical protein T02_3857 [Trichinella nativa]